MSIKSSPFGSIVGVVPGAGAGIVPGQSDAFVLPEADRPPVGTTAPSPTTTPSPTTIPSPTTASAPVTTGSLFGVAPAAAGPGGAQSPGPLVASPSVRAAPAGDPTMAGNFANWMAKNAQTVDSEYSQFG